MQKCQCNKEFVRVSNNKKRRAGGLKEESQVKESIWRNETQLHSKWWWSGSPGFQYKDLVHM